MVNPELPHTRTLTERLMPLCCRNRAHMNKPIAIEIVPFGRMFLAACDGSMVVAVASEEPGAETEDTVRKELTRLIEERVPQYATATTSEKLRAWSGEPVWQSTCPECKGDKTVLSPGDCSNCEGEGEVTCYCMDCSNEHTRDCQTCDGTGDGPVEKGTPTDCDRCAAIGTIPELLSKEADPGRVERLVVDRRRLARLLSMTDEGECSIWADDQRFNARGKDWHLTLMALFQVETKDEEFQP